MLTINQLEDVVEHEIAPCAVWHQLKDLRIFHWPLLLVNLENAH